MHSMITCRIPWIRLYPRMSLSMVTVLKGDAPYEQGYHVWQSGLLPPSSTSLEEAQEASAHEEERASSAAGRGCPTEPSPTLSGTCFGRAANGRLSIGIGSGSAQASSTSVSRGGGEWVSSRS